MKEKRSILFYGLVIVLLFVLLGSFFWANQNDDLSYSQIVDLIKTGQVQEFYVKDNIIYLTMNDSYAGARELQCELADVASFREENADMIRQQYEAGILKEYNYLPDSEPSFLEQALPWLLVGAGLILLWGIMAKRANSAGNMAGFGKARANVGTSNHKVRAGDRQEAHTGLAGHSLGQQRLAGARRADQQHALGNAGTQRNILLGFTHELHDLLQFFLLLIRAGHILERDLLVLFG